MLKEIRAASLLTQTHVSEQLGRSQSSMSDVETGARPLDLNFEISLTSQALRCYSSLQRLRIACRRMSLAAGVRPARVPLTLD